MIANLDQLVDLAAYLSVTANSEETRAIAARKRLEAYMEIAKVEMQLARLRAVLGLFSTPGPVLSEAMKERI